jgi:hypothetical protein
MTHTSNHTHESVSNPRPGGLAEPVAIGVPPGHACTHVPPSEFKLLFHGLSSHSSLLSPPGTRRHLARPAGYCQPAVPVFS